MSAERVTPGHQLSRADLGHHTDSMLAIGEPRQSFAFMCCIRPPWDVWHPVFVTHRMLAASQAATSTTPYKADFLIALYLCALDLCNMPFTSRRSSLACVSGQHFECAGTHINSKPFPAGSAMRNHLTPTRVRTSLQISVVFLIHASKESTTDET